MGSWAGNRPWLRQWPSLRVMKSETESGLTCSKPHRGTTMEHYAGIDVSLESASICVVDASGRIVREAKVASEPEVLIGWFGGLGRVEEGRGGVRHGQLPRFPSPSRPGEFHPEPLTEPDVRLSPHPARATQRRLTPSGKTVGFLRSPVDPTSAASDPPPSLHGHYPASSLLWGGPRLTGPSVLSASRVRRLCLFPYHGQPGSQVPYEGPDESHAS